MARVPVLHVGSRQQMCPQGREAAGVSAPKRVDEYTVFRPTGQYRAMLWTAAAAVLVTGFVCIYQGLAGRGLALFVVGGFLIVVSLLVGANAVAQRSRAFYLGTDGFRDVGMLGDIGFVGWDRVEDVEVRSRTLVRLYMVPPSGPGGTEHQLGSPRMEARRGNAAGPGPKGRGRDAWIVISCQGYSLPASNIARLIDERLAAARSAGRARRPSHRPVGR
jgi:hypothetical protein